MVSLRNGFYNLYFCIEKIAVWLFLLQLVRSQDLNCDYSQYVQPDRNYDIFSPNYPFRVNRNVLCRWIATCPDNYYCQLDCNDVDITESEDCQVDRLLISKDGDPQLKAADRYCGRGRISVTSFANIISIGFQTSRRSRSRFRCRLTAKKSTENLVFPELPPVQLTSTARPSTVASSRCDCGKKWPNRVVGGNETKVNEFPMMAGLIYEEDVIFCGGTIISQFFIVTAGHCLTDKRAESLKIVVGEHNVNTDDETPYTNYYQARWFKIHEQYRYGTGNPIENDIAIVQTTQRIEFLGPVGPACLPYRYMRSRLVDSTVTFLGWGSVRFGEPDSNVLLRADVKVISNSLCQQSNQDIICTYADMKDSCQNDSGGPVLLASETGQLFLVGIISSGQLCAVKDAPGLNTRVTSYLQWIETNTASRYCRV